MGMAAHWDGPELSVEASDDLLCHLEEQTDELAMLDPRFLRGGDRYMYFPHYESEEAAEAARIARIFQDPWAQAAHAMLQPGFPLHIRGGGSKNQRRKRIMKADERRERQRQADLNEPLVQRARVIVRCLTFGERTYYSRRGAEGALILSQHAARMSVEGSPLVTLARAERVICRASDLILWVTQETAKILSLDRGAPRRVLSEHARELAGDYVDSLDRSYVERYSRKKVVPIDAAGIAGLL